MPSSLVLDIYIINICIFIVLFNMKVMLMSFNDMFCKTDICKTKESCIIKSAGKSNKG